MNTIAAAFLLGFPSLFSNVNPISGAFIFRTRALDRGPADRIARIFGQMISRAITRLSAFFQLCIGTQILITGVTEVLHPLLQR